MKRAMKLAQAIGRRKTVCGKRKAILAWCKEMRKVLS